jgi:hypothetical protein
MMMEQELLRSSGKIVLRACSSQMLVEKSLARFNFQKNGEHGPGKCGERTLVFHSFLSFHHELFRTITGDVGVITFIYMGGLTGG